MKKIKKMIAIVLSTLLAMIPVMSTSIVSFAKSGTTVTGEVVWYDYDNYYAPFATTTAVLNVAEDHGDYGFYGERWEADEDSYWYYVEAYDDADYFYPGDTVTFNLPFAVDLTKIIDLDWNSYWDFVLVSPTCIVGTCIKNSQFPWVEVCLPKPAASNDEFWFKDMKTQLAIAAEVAASSNKEAVAEVSGDFGLSYQIMKWLEDHPNVTLKYTLTYKEKDYNIVIKGGQKLADVKIPWYGPEYLIGKFSK